MKEKNIFQRLDLRIEQLVTYPGCDQKMLNTRKTMWIATVFGLVHVILHTGAFLIFAPQSLHLLHQGVFRVQFLYKPVTLRYERPDC